MLPIGETITLSARGFEPDRGVQNVYLTTNLMVLNPDLFLQCVKKRDWWSGVIPAFSLRRKNNEELMISTWVRSDNYEESRVLALDFWTAVGIESEMTILPPTLYPMISPPSNTIITSTRQMGICRLGKTPIIPLGTMPFKVLDDLLFYRGVSYGIIIGKVLNLLSWEHGQREYVLRTLWRLPQVESWRSPVYNILFWLASEDPDDFHGLSFIIKNERTVCITLYGSDGFDLAPDHYLKPILPFFDVERIV
jgi:hypothetical protein